MSTLSDLEYRERLCGSMDKEAWDIFVKVEREGGNPYEAIFKWYAGEWAEKYDEIEEEV
jgi:hypothetical protein